MRLCVGLQKHSIRMRSRRIKSCGLQLGLDLDSALSSIDGGAEFCYKVGGFSGTYKSYTSAWN